MSGFLDIRRRSRHLGRREPVVDGPQDGLRPGRDAYLAVGAANVGLDGVDAHDQGAGDLVIAQARGDEPEHVRLSRSETNFAAWIVAALPLLGCRVVLEVAGDGVPDDGDQLVGRDAKVDGPLDALLLGPG